MRIASRFVIVFLMLTFAVCLVLGPALAQISKQQFPSGLTGHSNAIAATAYLVDKSPLTRASYEIGSKLAAVKANLAKSAQITPGEINVRALETGRIGKIAYADILNPISPPTETPPTPEALANRLNKISTEQLIKLANQHRGSLHPLTRNLLRHPPDITDPNGQLLLNRILLEDLFPDLFTVRRAAEYGESEESGYKYPKSAFRVGASVRELGDATIVVQDLLYSDARANADLGFQSFFGDLRGYGVGIRFNLSPSIQAGYQSAQRAESNLEAIEPLLEPSKQLLDRRQLLQTNALGSPQEEKKVLGHLLIADRENDGVLKDLLRAAVTPQPALIAGYRDIEAQGISATIANYGIALSLLRPLGTAPSDPTAASAKAPAGILGVANLEGVSYNFRGPIQDSTKFRWTLALAIQERVPMLIGPSQDVSRGRWLGGIEYRGTESADLGSIAALFARYRPHRFTEFGVTAGWPDHSGPYFGFNIAAAFYTY